jgi:hypothetical protein
MEADWAAEVGPDLPSIDIPWEGFVDLREVSSLVQVVKEATDHHALGRALITMNSEASPVFSTKCDVWSFSGFEIDHDEFGSLAGAWPNTSSANSHPPEWSRRIHY